MSEKRWKLHERKIAAKLGGARVPITGRSRGSAPDIAHALYAIECKSRQVLPGWIREAMAQAEASKRNGQRIAIAVLHEVNTRHDADLVVISLRDFTDWCGSVGLVEETPS